MVDSLRRQLTGAALLAPSADNEVPYMLSWADEGQELSFSLNSAKCGKSTDRLYTLSDLATGAAIESVVLEALRLKFRTKVQLFPEGEGDPYKVAHLTFSPLEEPLVGYEDDVELARQIPLRCTDRRFPFKGPVTDEVVSCIKDTIRDKAFDLLGYSDRQQIAAILPLIFKAEKLRFESRLLHHELFKSVSFTYQPVSTGMNLSVLGVKGFEAPAFYLFSKWPVLKVLNYLGASSFLAAKSVKAPISKSPALLLLTVPSASREHMLGAGRELQRVWLKCTALGLSVQVYAAPGVLSLVKPPLGRKQLQALEDVEEGLEKLTGAGKRGLLFLRVGLRADRPPRSGRQSHTA